MNLYYKLTEINEWYNEKWEWFIPLKNNKNVLERLNKLVKEYGKGKFEMSNKLYKEAEVNKLLKENNNTIKGYQPWLPPYNKLIGKLRNYVCENIYSYETLENKLNLGQIQNYIREE